MNDKMHGSFYTIKKVFDLHVGTNHHMFALFPVIALRYTFPAVGTALHFFPRLALRSTFSHA